MAIMIFKEIELKDKEISMNAQQLAPKMKSKKILALLGLIALPWVNPALSAPFISGSNGSDGALNLSTPGTILLASLGLDADGDGVYHFSSINIAEGVNLVLKGHGLPVQWLATGDINIAGDIDISGSDGHQWNEVASPAIPGFGGYSGGLGYVSSVQPSSDGKGPGGGSRCSTSSSGSAFIYNHGGGAGFSASGGQNCQKVRSVSYGNTYSLPLLGGSGGGGGHWSSSGFPDTLLGGGGGAGGGAILMASSTTININGLIDASGGDGGKGGVSITSSSSIISFGGGGSGGAVRLIAPTITGSGTIIVAGGKPGIVGSATTGNGYGSHGRLRIEAEQTALTGNVGPATVYSTPGKVSLFASDAPVRIVSIAGVAVPANASGGTSPADIVFNQSGPVSVAIEAKGVPVGTLVQVSMITDTGDIITVDSTALAGSLTLSTATATVTIPYGFNRFMLRANW